ncbi:hypothetical protein GCM10027416_18020 [Okibacterium endophyticum]
MSELTSLPMLVASDDLIDYSATIRSALPISLSAAEGIDGALVAVSGAAAGWVGEVARLVDAGARGILVERPGRIASDDIDALRRASTRVPVALRREYLSNPLLDGSRDAWPSAVGALSLTSDQFIAPGTDLGGALFDHLAVARALTEKIAGVRVLETGPGGYTVTASLTGGTSVVLGGVVSAIEPTRVTLQLLRPPQRLSIEIPTAETSRPATVAITDADGERRLPSSYESVHRAAWRRLVAAAQKDERVDDVADYLVDLALFATIEDRPAV